MKINKILEILNADTFVGIIETVNPDYIAETVLDQYFPNRKVIGLDYSYIKHARGQVELTSPSAFDAEPISQNRESFDAVKGELPLFRKKMKLSEKERAQLITLMKLSQYNEVQKLIELIFDDEMRLVEGAMMTQEFLRARVLMDGAITMNSKGGAISINYNIPAGHKEVLTGTDAWTDYANANPITDIMGWVETIGDELGVKPNRMVMSRKTFRDLRQCHQVRDNILSPLIIGTPSSDNITFQDWQISESIRELTGVTIIVHNKTVTLDGTTLNIIEDDKISLFPDVQLGNTLVGTSPAETDASFINDAGGNVAVTSSGFAVNTTITTRAPYTIETEIEFVSVPSFQMSDYVFLATVA